MPRRATAPGSRSFDDAASQLPAAEQRATGRAAWSRARRPTAARSASGSERAVEVVARVSWGTYDQYLKSQGVSEGVRSYSRVVQLLLGSGALDWQ